MNHAQICRHYPDAILLAIIADLARRNLRDYRDHAVRWCGRRLAAARAERRRRDL